MRSRLLGLLGLLFFLPFALLCQSATGPLVRFHTNLGDIDVELLTDDAPKTVANFLNYVNRGAYNNSLIHRSVPGFIIQGGGYRLGNQNSIVAIPEDPPVPNEFKVSNTRGTLAMAKLGTDPNSATNEWFFNEADNSQNLDSQNGGFTVFGRIANSAGIAVMDRIGALPVPPVFLSPLDELPLVNYTGGSVLVSNLVLVTSITMLDNSALPTVAANGIVSASGFGGFSAATAGSFIEIYGSNLATGTRGWSGSDFKNGNAPTSLGDVTVTVNGQPAYVAFVSTGQVNVQVPANVPSSGSAPVVVTSKGKSSLPSMLALKTVEGGLLAPPDFKAGGKQYVVAFHGDGTMVSNGTVPAFPGTPAKPGEILIFYGVGFGPVTSSSTPIAGKIATGLSDISTPLQFYIGQLAAQISYKGFAPGFVGVYQFNVKVPDNAPNGDLPVRVALGGSDIHQTLFITVQY